MKHSWWFYKAALVSMARKECLPYGRTLRLSAPTGFHRATRIPFSRPPIEVMLHRGWHKLLLKLPIGEVPTPEAILVKWMLTAAKIYGQN